MSFSSLSSGSPTTVNPAYLSASPVITKLTHVSVEVFSNPGQPSRWFEVPLDKGLLVFRNNAEFGRETDFPSVPLDIYDIYHREFLTIPTYCAMMFDSTINPWIILRNSRMTDDECTNLKLSVENLLKAIDYAPWDSPANPPLTPLPAKRARSPSWVDVIPEPRRKRSLKSRPRKRTMNTGPTEVIDLTLDW